MAIMRPGPEDASPEPQLDLGKKMSTTHDLMIEELSLPHNRGSRLFQQRQKRVQRFVLEHPSGSRQLPGQGAGGSHHTGKGDPEGTVNEQMSGENAGGQENYHSELHVAASPQGGPPEVPKKSEKVLHMSKVLNPSALAPGYSSPLKEIPHEKFNVTAIPKGYRSPWQELFGDRDNANAVYGKNPPPMRPPAWDFRSFNRTPAPFDRALVGWPKAGCGSCRRAKSCRTRVPFPMAMDGSLTGLGHSQGRGGEGGQVSFVEAQLVGLGCYLQVGFE
uniref:Myozenin 3 n=1 Tax=Taeniopygia guttata TaxID=59729 RepID=H0YRH2_TAEGU